MQRTKVYTLLALALMVVLLIPDPAQGGWWGRTSISRIMRINHIDNSRNTHYHRKRKRGGVALSNPLTETDLPKLAGELTTSCPLVRDAIRIVLATKFEDLDADEDNKLTGTELIDFNTFLRSHNACPPK